MDFYLGQPPSFDERLTSWWDRAVRLATRLAIAFGLAVVAGILLSAAVTDNGLVQVIVTAFAALGLWIPLAVLVTRIDRFFADRSARRARNAERGRAKDQRSDDSWSRLAAVAPRHSERLSVLQRSLDRSRLALGSADLDPDAHDLCVLMDRRLPELIHRELDTLPPDDTNRARQIGDLVDLIEQFARHCSRKRSGEVDEAGFEAAVLRRRFEDRLADPQIGSLP